MSLGRAKLKEIICYQLQARGVLADKLKDDFLGFIIDIESCLVETSPQDGCEALDEKKLDEIKYKVKLADIDIHDPNIWWRVRERYDVAFQEIIQRFRLPDGSNTGMNDIAKVIEGIIVDRYESTVEEAYKAMIAELQDFKYYLKYGVKPVESQPTPDNPDELDTLARYIWEYHNDAQDTWQDASTTDKRKIIGLAKFLMESGLKLSPPSAEIRLSDEEYQSLLKSTCDNCEARAELMEALEKVLKLIKCRQVYDKDAQSIIEKALSKLGDGR